MNEVATITEPRGIAFSQDDITLIKDTICKGATDSELKLFMNQCKATGLNPFARQIYAVKRWDSNLKREAMATQTSIDGFRLIAERSGKYSGQLGPFWCSEDGKWTDVWLSKTAPIAAKIGVLRNDFKEPCYAVARFDAYAQRKKEGDLTAMWLKMGDLMIAKCYDIETEVLTDNGFMKFAEISDESIMMVSGDKLIPVKSKPFMQDYNGDMVCYDSDDINFSVTPNHDMITTFGKVEALALYKTSNQRGPWHLPRITGNFLSNAGSLFELAGYVLADGWLKNGNTWSISVSKPEKINILRKLGLHDRELVAHTAGAMAVASSGRQIRSNFDKAVFVYDKKILNAILNDDKQLQRDLLVSCSPSEAKTIIDAWQKFDGDTNKKTEVRRIYISDHQRLRGFETLAIKAGYSISKPHKRQSDIGKPNYSLTLSDRSDLPVFRHAIDNRPSLHLKKNMSGVIWCVTVPSGKIVIRRNGFSMICGNCAEALALRKAFPQELSGLYTSDEMAQIEIPPEIMPDRPMIKGLFGNSALRNKWCDNAVKSMKDAQTKEEVLEILNLNRPRCEELLANGNEFDVLAVESIKQNADVILKRFKNIPREGSGADIEAMRSGNMPPVNDSDYHTDEPIEDETPIVASTPIVRNNTALQAGEAMPRFLGRGAA